MPDEEYMSELLVSLTDGEYVAFQRGQRVAFEQSARLCEAEGRARLGAMDSVANLTGALAADIRALIPSTPKGSEADRG
jgi:hypothetical protein